MPPDDPRTSRVDRVGVHALFVIASMTLLGVVVVSVAYATLEARGAACLFALPVVVAVGSGLAMGLQSLLDLDVVAVPAGVGLVLLALAGFASAAG